MSAITESWTPDNNPVDNQMKSCLASPDGQTTAGMLNCVGEAYRAWDNEINNTYGKLMEHYSPRDREDLAKDQKEFLKERDEQFRRIDEKYNRDGSIYPVLKIEEKTDVEKWRAIDLHRRYLVHENEEKR